MTGPVSVAPLRLGALTLDSPAFQGALSGFSDLPFRRVARAFGCAYAVNEVVLDENVLKPGTLQDEILHVAEDDHPVGGQLLGATPARFAAAAARLVEAGYDVVDVNFGCPVNKVLGRCRGGYLLSDPPVAKEILSRVRDVVPPHVPLTVKMRRASDDSAAAADRFDEILAHAFSIGVDAVCVHGRTVAQKYVGPSRRSFLKTVKQAYPDRVIIGSGDLFDELDVVTMLRETGVDGAWVARGGIGAPWIFPAIAHALRTGERAPPPSFSDQRRAVWLHHRESTTLHGRELGSRLFRSAAIKYAEAHPLGDVVKHAIYDCRVPADIEAVLGRYYDVDLAEDHFGPVRHREGPGNLVAAGASCG